MRPRDRSGGGRRRPTREGTAPSRATTAGRRRLPLEPLLSVPARLEAGQPFRIRVGLSLDSSGRPLAAGVASWLDVQVQACRVGSATVTPLARARVRALPDRPARTVELVAAGLEAGRYRLATLVTFGAADDVAAFSDGPVVTVGERRHR